MSHPNCSRIDYTAKPFPIVYTNRHCWLCDSDTSKKYSRFMPMLPALYAWLEDGEDFTSDQEMDLYEYFYHSMDYGTQTGDTGTLTEWLCNRPERVEELIARIESYCVFERQTA